MIATRSNLRHPRPRLTLDGKLHTVSCALGASPLGFDRPISCTTKRVLSYLKALYALETYICNLLTSGEMAGFGTRAVRSGLPRDATTGALVEPVTPRYPLIWLLVKKC